MRGDDEIGLEIVQRWIKENKGNFPEDQIEADILESPGVNLLGAIAGLNAAVLVDAVHSGAPAGTIHKLSENDLAAFSDGSGSVHGWGAAETLSLGRQLTGDDLPETIIIIGIEGVQFTLGEGLSPAVQNAIPEALLLIDQVLKRLLQENSVC